MARSFCNSAFSRAIASRCRSIAPSDLVSSASPLRWAVVTAFRDASSCL
ncbi:Uncharacterised protein [Mycobacterium tuberculosis]|nr:Uncharacterised protein [Mycobacterium tuberculosis]